LAGIVTETIDFPSDSRSLAGFLARPAGAGPFPGVIVIHEIHGLNDNIRDVTRRFADSGYAALAVDLFAGRNRLVCMARFFSGMLLNSLSHGGIGDLKAALSYLGSRPEVDPTRVGAIGFCLGGSFAIAWACTEDRLKAIAPYYAMNPRPLAAVARSCPVVGSYPEKDFTASAGRSLDAALARQGIVHDIKIYPAARHSFFNDHGANFDPAASDDAWQRTLAFFATHLTPAP
jgi:carboxymethylenebutenolidase